MSHTCTRCGRRIAVTADDPVVALSAPSGWYHFACAQAVHREKAQVTSTQRASAQQRRSEAAKARWHQRKGKTEMAVHQLLGDVKADESSLAQMKARGGKWAAYQNHAMDSAGLGHLQFLKYGEGCTYAAPPDKYPSDTEHGMGWRYLLVGSVDLESGEISSEV